MDVLVSVIVPIYNVEKYLDECLVHLERQTLKEIEVIMVNDGSTDGSSAIAQKYVDRNNNFRLINRDNGGQSAARNTGMKYANGKYLYFLDSDDYLDDTALYELFHTAEQNQLDVLKFSSYTFEENSKKIKWETYKYKGNYDDIYLGSQFLYMSKENRDIIVSPCMIFTRRDLIEEIQLRFYENIIYEDNLFHFILLALCRRVMVLNKPLYYRRYRAGSTTQSVDHNKKFKGFILSAESADQFLEKYSNLKGTGIEWYIYNFIMEANYSYRSLEKSQRKTEETRALYRIDRKLFFKYRKYSRITVMLFMIHPKLSWLYMDTRCFIDKVLKKTK